MEAAARNICKTLDKILIDAKDRTVFEASLMIYDVALRRLTEIFKEPQIAEFYRELGEDYAILTIPTDTIQVQDVQAKYTQEM